MSYEQPLLPPRGLEPLSENRQGVENKALTENQYLVLSTSLDKILQKHPEVKAIIETWPNLPEHIKAAIKALVQTCETEK